MDDLKAIEENYRRMRTDELLHLSKTPQDLRLEVIPLLQKELLNRHQQEEALMLSSFLINSREQHRFKNLTKKELKELIQARLDSGESLESIKLDLKDDGINIFDIINEENKLLEKTFDYITHLKNEGLGDEEIDEKLQKDLAIEKQEVDIIKERLRKRGKLNLSVGYTLLSVAVIFSIISLSAGGQITIKGILAAGIAIWRIIVGHDQLK